MKKLLLWVVGAVALYLGFSFVKYYISEAFDYSDRPWAYSRDVSAPLLVGKWKGDFTDPDGVKKAIQLEIFLPETDSERLGKALKTSRRRKFGSSKTAFDGIVTVTSKLGKEEYEINGGVSKDDIHQFHFKFYQVENTKRVLPNFTLNEGKNGKWNGNDLEFSAKFSYHKADGSSIWTSADARFSTNVLVPMVRIR